MATFAGFTEPQKEVLARKLGFKGDMGQFDNFLRSDNSLASKFAAYENKAKTMVESSQAKRGYAFGGLVTHEQNPTTQQPTTGGSPTGNTTTETTPNTSPTTTQTLTTATSGNKTSTTNVVLPNLNSTGSQLTEDMLNNPSQYSSAPTTSNVSVQQDQLINPNSGQMAETPGAVAGTSSTTTAAPVTETSAPQVSTATSGSQVTNATQGMEAVQGTVSQQGQAVAVTVDPSVNATVRGQLEQLMSQFEGGKVPAWAAGAIRNANAISAQRGLGASSIAASAVTQAAMESTLEIAIRDAATYSTFEQQNLNNRQQAAMQNAQAFLQMDLANLDAAQQTNVLKQQSVIQSIFSDQAAENASRQFNASSQAQTDQFFANMKAQVNQFNAAQKNAMEQFNVDQTNSVSQFNAQLAAAREQFNATNRLVVDQSNAEWRRQVTTINNAEANENARLTAQLNTSLTTAAYNNMMQKERDYYAFAYQSTESSLQRANELAIARMGASAERAGALGSVLGSLAGKVINNLFEG